MADNGSTKPTTERFEGEVVDQQTATGPFDIYVDGEPIRRDDAAVIPPEKIGRYRVERLLGQGGFGQVYLAYDDQLNRLVAVKIPHHDRLQKPADAAPYLAEARMVASLDHPNIVPVLDVGSTADFPCFVVSKYIAGITLSRKIRTALPAPVEAAKLVATIADALHYAHNQDIVHRDVKPGNVLLDQKGTPFLVDFGLALNDQNGTDTYKYAGTPSYMSPEQARGEGHLVDGRADIFGLGVMLYELLTGTRPFQGMSSRELIRAVATQEPRPLRQRTDKIPRELERVCLQALSKQVSERHLTAKDFADDLRAFLARHSDDPQAGQEGSVGVHDSSPSDAERRQAAGASGGVESKLNSPRVVPKGLRSFDGEDEEFFLSLLPGPRDRQGLPQSVRFWKSRLEDCASPKPFRVGAVYGPSGCGKSPFVCAGLLPRLKRSVVPLVLAATPDGTERRLLEQLRPQLPEGCQTQGLSAAFQRLRLRQRGPRLLVVIDQFEQWLHANDSSSDCELVQALRQCDGVHVACLIIVRGRLLDVGRPILQAARHSAGGTGEQRRDRSVRQAARPGGAARVRTCLRDAPRTHRRFVARLERISEPRDRRIVGE